LINVDSSFLNKLKDLENFKMFTELDTRISNKEIINAIFETFKTRKIISFKHYKGQRLLITSVIYIYSQGFLRSPTPRHTSKGEHIRDLILIKIE
jgi:hypothetical protein